MIIVRWPDNNFFVSVVAFVSSEYLMTSSGGQVECDCCRVCDESCKKDEEAGGKTFLSQSTSVSSPISSGFGPCLNCLRQHRTKPGNSKILRNKNVNCKAKGLIRPVSETSCLEYPI